MIRKGQDFSFVEVAMYLENCNLEYSGNIVVSREVYQNGRNTCKINGRLVTVTQLKKFMREVIDIHGQHENQSLLDESVHIKFLDEFAEDEIIDIKKSYNDNYKKYNALKEEINKNFGDEKERQRELDLLKYQNREIEDAELK